MNIREIENSIISKLKQNFPEVLVEGFPDKPSEFILLHPVGALLVHYQGSNYSQSNAISFISQENKKEFSIIGLLCQNHYKKNQTINQNNYLVE